jgi:hypothetical protein
MTLNTRKKHQVRFNDFLEGVGDYDVYRFAIVEEPDKGEPGKADSIERWRVEVSRSLQMELAKLGIDLAPIAAKSIELHLLGTIPPEHYHQDKERTIRLTTYWYPGHPGKPEGIVDFGRFEVIPPTPGSATRPTESQYKQKH